MNNINEPKIALMCKSHNYQYMPTTNTFVTGDWVISSKRQQELFGTNVILTEGQKNLAYLGGRIVGFIPTNQSSAQTQCKVVFQPNPELVGNSASLNHSNWGTGRSVCYID